MRKKGWICCYGELDMLSETVYAKELVEPLGDSFCRVHLPLLDKHGLNPKTLFRLFVMTSRSVPGSDKALLAKLKCFQKMCVSGELPFDPAAVPKFDCGI